MHSMTRSLDFSLVLRSCRKGFLVEHSESVGMPGSPMHTEWGEIVWASLEQGPSLLSGSLRVNLHSSLAALPLSRACWDFLPAVLHHEDLCVGEIPGHSCN